MGCESEPMRVGLVQISRVEAASWAYLGLGAVLYQHLGVLHALPESLGTLMILLIVGVCDPLLAKVPRRHPVARVCGGSVEIGTRWCLLPGASQFLTPTLHARTQGGVGS